MNSSFYFLQLIVGIVLWLVIWLGPFCAILWLGYYLISLRLRRQERARFFLDLIETGLKHGRRVEDTIISISESRDGSMGVYFHLLAFHLKAGLSLREAMEKVPRLLPAQILAMLKAGLQIGDFAKVLPACRQLSKDAVSQTRGAINYLVALAFVGFPINIAILTILQIYVIPQFMAVCYGMEVPVPTGLIFLTRFKGLFLLIQLVIFVFVWGAALIYIDGPRLFSWLEKACAPVAHRLLYALPWRHKRMQRDFSAMLAILLDAGMPEPEALTVAADCTANNIFRQRARAAVAALQQGMKLTEAIQILDDNGEFRWRLTNAMSGRGGFFKAIAGWNESLDAKAFQQEQATAQAVTAGLVVLNGIMVGFIVVSVFSVLIAIINGGVLW